jgi:AraC-like DNA-binding protein
MPSTSERLILDLRSFGVSEVLMLGRYNYRQAREGLFPHAHEDCLEICYLAKGRQLYRVGRKDFVLTGGDVFVTFPGETHSTGESPEEKGYLYWLIIQVPRPSTQFLNCTPKDGWILAQQLLHMPHRHFAGDSELGKIFQEIILACHQPDDPLQHVRIQNRLVDFLLRVIACSKKRPKLSVSVSISSLLRYIEANVHQELPIGALAARGGLSLPRFKGRFKQEVGIPPAEYVLRCKIEAAKKLLLQPRANVTAVAFELNFSSSQYFATVFRRYTGASPRDFLRR